MSDSGFFQKMQSEVDRLKAQNQSLQEKLESVENLDEILAEANKAKGEKLEAEASALRNRLVSEKYPSLKGKEHLVSLGSPDEMEKRMVDLQALIGEQKKQPENQNEISPKIEVKVDNLQAPAGAPQGGITAEQFRSLSDEEKVKVMGTVGDEVLKAAFNIRV